MKSILTKNQKKSIEFKNKDLDGEKVDLILNIRYDDECGNGHNSFSMTADIYEAGKRSDRAMIMCGCCHEEIKKVAPGYSKYLKWHLMSSDEPLHYVANTFYHARTKDCYGLEKGEVKQTEKKILFNDLPITFKKDKEFIAYLENEGQNKDFEIVEIPHKDQSGYRYSSKYTFKGFIVEWYKCPFDSLEEANEWKEALMHHTFKIVEIPTAWGEGSKADLESARISAIAPDATLKQLQSEEWLKNRIPQLQRDFKQAVEELGFIY